MSSILQVSDFSAKGRFHLSVNGQNEGGLEVYIDEVQDDILKKLLGCDLAALLITDFGVTDPQRPAAQIYKNIFDPFCQDLDCGILESKGMIAMLKGLTFWYYFRDDRYKRTTSGPKQNKAETSDDVSLSAFGLAAYWNNAEETFSAIQYYIRNEDPDSYPDYNGVSLDTVSPF